MNITEIVDKINLLEKEVQTHTHSYMMDADCTSVIDAQLNGYVKSIIAYCKLNQLYCFEETINEVYPIEHNAIEFLCLWDGVKDDIIEHLLTLQGKTRLNIVNSIAYYLQSEMTKSEIDVYLNSFSVCTPDFSSIVGSKRVYVTEVLKSVDGITVKNIAKDLNLISKDLIEVEIEDKVSSEFVAQQISKCNAKMNSQDYDGAITNARTLIEEILLCVEEKIQGARQDYNGDILTLYKRVSKQMNMYPDDSDIGNSFNQILRGFISILNGFAGISNNIADRHATAKHPHKHHAKIAVNSALVISEFILESYEYQQNR